MHWLLVAPVRGFLLEEHTLGVISRTALPRWRVGWREFRHEGDAGYYRTLVDRSVVHRTAQVAAQKPGSPREWTVPVRDSLGVDSKVD
ncbi:hypothetical protein BIV25_05360 [Streptomyces sp. MUSC 14]|uniref:hypothetical protein n=1 Tax=Streptomyces sp. MUSC 14 TaxID=1354889 RepID=UPI0008F5C26A|nr:hypothetical protein [Streptomyces sp. MUSC 14]OIK01808.1 hypothetical protein BIV25_05360 [Streptomyces sp. MUSC 14]